MLHEERHDSGFRVFTRRMGYSQGKILHLGSAAWGAVSGWLGHKARRQRCPLYVSGLIGPWRSQEHSADGRAACARRVDQLHHLVTAGDATRGVDVDDRPLTMRSVLNAMPPC